MIINFIIFIYFNFITRYQHDLEPEVLDILTQYMYGSADSINVRLCRLNECTALPTQSMYGSADSTNVRLCRLNQCTALPTQSMYGSADSLIIIMHYRSNYLILFIYLLLHTICAALLLLFTIFIMYFMHGYAGSIYY